MTYPATELDPDGRAVRYHYDDADQLHSVTDWNGNTTTFTYDPDGEAATIATPNGITDTRTYDIDDRVTDISDTVSDVTLAKFVYGYNQDGDITSDSDTLNDSTTSRSYTYTDDSQLDTSPAGTYSDDSANQLSQLPDGTTLDYDDAGELTTATTSGDTTTEYGDNDLGERTSITPPSGSATSLTYGQDGALASYAKGDTSVTYSSDGNGLRAAASGDTDATYTWNITGLFPQLLDDGTSSYLYGPTGVYEQVQDSTDTPTYVGTDQAGSGRLLTDGSGNQTGTYTYGDYGASSHTGTATTAIGFDGGYTDPSTGYIYLIARDYDPGTGQFLTVDPYLEATGTPYAYAQNDAVNKDDPDGKSAASTACNQLPCERFWSFIISAMSHVSSEHAQDLYNIASYAWALKAFDFYSDLAADTNLECAIQAAEFWNQRQDDLEAPETAGATQLALDITDDITKDIDEIQDILNLPNFAQQVRALYS